MRGHKEEPFSKVQLRLMANEAVQILAMWGLSAKDALDLIDYMRQHATAELTAPKSGKAK